MRPAADPPVLPTHIENTILSIARLHAQHHERATPLEKALERITAQAARPGFLGLLAGLVAGWALFNLALGVVGRQMLDRPPFFWMQGVIGLAALCMTTVILITQRRDDQLTDLREQLNLELALLSDQKSAKIIQLLEEMRRDHPQIHDRVDSEAVAMAAPADTETMLDAIRNRQATTGPAAPPIPSA